MSLSIAIVVILIFALFGLRIANQYQRAVVFRLGKYQATRGPGLYWIIPLIEWQQTLDIRTVTAAVEQQETITKDNVPVKINAVVWYRILDPKRAILEVVGGQAPQHLVNTIVERAHTLARRHPTQGLAQR